MGTETTAPITGIKKDAIKIPAPINMVLSNLINLIQKLF